jgi:hypothetical protein
MLNYVKGHGNYWDSPDLDLQSAEISAENTTGQNKDKIH